MECSVYVVAQQPRLSKSVELRIPRILNFARVFEIKSVCQWNVSGQLVDCIFSILLIFVFDAHSSIPVRLSTFPRTHRIFVSRDSTGICEKQHRDSHIPTYFEVLEGLYALRFIQKGFMYPQTLSTRVPFPI